MVIVDSSVWIDYFADRPTPQVEALDQLLGHEEVGTGDLMVVELLWGARLDRDFQRLHSQLLDFEIFPMGGTDLAIAAAQNFRALRRKGLTVRGAVDCLIATFCIENDHILLHNDRDFEPFEKHLGLRVLR